jgi:alkylation response protein AidB-like acyl-CoA dehydrogenase
MAIGVTEDQAALADSVAGFVARYAPREATRAEFETLGAGGVFGGWDKLVEQGLVTLHLPEEIDGGGAGPVDLAVVVEESGRGLLPGHLLPTVLTSDLLSRRGSGSARVAELLGRFAEGARGAVALSTTGLSATRSGDGIRISGASSPVLGLVGADVVVLGAAGPDGEVWFAVDGDAVKSEALESVDPTRGVARAVLDGLDVPADSVVQLTTEQVRDHAAVLFSAEAVGLVRWCLETGLAYIKVREQFGRTVGSFQAIKHKAARMYSQLEVMSAAAWDAARALDDSAEQLSLAAAEAAVQCLPGAVDLALETVTLLGGIGYTWEHDTHLYWRRAIALSSLLGPASAWESRLGQLAQTAIRNFDLDLVEVEPAFRERIASQLREVKDLPEEERRAKLGDLGLVSPHYPEPYGLSATPAQQLVIAEEFAHAGIPQPSTVIGEWALPTILAHGTKEQQDFFVRPTLRGDITWCQLFSEPGAGSDLASLSTRGEKVEGGWRLNGQKVWNSMAQIADWGICLARTNPDVPKHKGISYFLIDMKNSEGLDVRPLREANGHYLFNEVFFNDVFVPDDRLVGEVDDGWRLARTTLGNERVSIGSGMGVQRFGLTDLVRSDVVAGNDDAVQTFGRLTAESYALAAMGLRLTLRRLEGLTPGGEASVLKLAAVKHRTEVARVAMSWYGPEAATLEGPAGEAVQGYLSTPSSLIGGGTTEIQLNVIGERVLGLPRS